MRRKLFLVLALAIVGFSKTSFAQGYGGLFNSNYSPTNTMYFNPASIADSRQKIQVNLFSFNAYLNNTQGEFGNIKNAIFNNGKLTFDIPNNNRNNNMDAIGEIRLPSFVATINPRHSVGLGIRSRTFLQVSELPSSLIYMYKNQIQTMSQVIPGNFAASSNVFNEINGSYGVVLMDNGKNVLKAGINAKYLMGVYSANLYDRKDFSYEVTNVISQNNYNVRTRDVDVTLKTSDANINNLDIDNIIKRSYQFGNKSTGNGFGFDVGFEYEWRPNYQERSYTMDGKQQIDRSMIPYKLKVGAALADFGRIAYKGQNAQEVSILSPERIFNSNQINENDIFNSIKNIYASDLSTTQGMKYNLPTSLNVNVDYNINNKFLVAANMMQGLTNSTKSIATMGTFASVVPRYEVRKFGVSVPVSYNSKYNDRVNVGLGLRAGFFFIGTDDLAGMKFLSNKNVRSANIYAGFNFSIPHKRLMDTDGDGVSDKFDKCPDVAGPAENGGCPWADRDNDGIPDKEDKCPDQPGSKATNGCPDKDGDGVPDNEDKCPDVAGLARFQGCPDTDGDGVPDNEDKCPEKPGPISNGGCPEVKEVRKVVTLTKVEEKIVFTAVQNLQFDTGKATIKKYSFASLDNLAKLLKDKNSLTLTLSGHTDNVGGKDLNQRLSEKRAQAVKDYLVNKGVEASQITARGYGMSKPIDTNATAAGRAKNRRVEFKVE